MQKNKILTVSQLNNYAEKVLGNDPILQSIGVKGEISNLKHHSSGHIYFSIKDNLCRINCVMFRSHAVSLKQRLENGQKVIVRGKVSLYAATGQYQLYARSIEEEGLGDLFLRYQALKKQLEEEGIFETSRKKPIKKMPNKVAVITSPTGAAIRDIIHVLKRRNSAVQIVVVPCQVQGMAAASQIADAISIANEHTDADTLIVGRGGGSIEELWAFNEEVVARAVAGSNIPVISAVGHETDYTIIDFVADLRAPTPSAAAEICTLDVNNEKELLAKKMDQVESLVNGQLFYAKNQLKNLLKNRIYQTPLIQVEAYHNRLQDAQVALDTAMEGYLKEKKRNQAMNLTVLNQMNPLLPYTRGFATVHLASGEHAKSAEPIDISEQLEVRFDDGTICCSVIDKRMKEQKSL